MPGSQLISFEPTSTSPVYQRVYKQKVYHKCGALVRFHPLWRVPANWADKLHALASTAHNGNRMRTRKAHLKKYENTFAQHAEANILQVPDAQAEGRQSCSDVPFFTHDRAKMARRVPALSGAGREPLPLFPDDYDGGRRAASGTKKCQTSHRIAYRIK